MKLLNRFPAFRNWKLILSIVLPFLLLPIAFLGNSDTDTKRYRCGYTILVMGIFWILELMPICVTAFLPVFLFPVLGVQPTNEVLGNYMKESQMMFIGGISIALSLQKSNLHKRIALRIMILIGSSPWRLLFGILVTTTVLSCVIVVNTAVVAMMSPIVVGVVDGLGFEDGSKKKRKLKVAFLLAVGYGANIGGTSTIIGSLPAIIYKDLIDQENVGQDGKYMSLNFFTYSAFSLPLAAICIIIVWVVLGFIFLRNNNNQKSLKSSSSTIEIIQIPRIDINSKENNYNNGEEVSKMLRKKYNELGVMEFQQYATIAVLTLAVLLWFTRDPQVFPGWLSLFPEGTAIDNSSVAIGALILLFIIPKDIKYFKRNYEGKSESLLTWSYIHENYPWNVIFICGGGLAISDGTTKSGLSDWIGAELLNLQTLPRPIMLLILLMFISMFTEFISNTGCISLITPILLSLSKSLNIHPLYLSFPGAIACQYAFVLPTSNQTIAIVYSYGDMRISDLAKPGIILNFSCILVLYFMNLTWGDYVLFNYRDYTYPNSTLSI